VDGSRRVAERMSPSGREVVATSGAPAAIGPYCQALRVPIPDGASGFVFCSGQIGLDPSSGRLVEGGVEAETARVLDNLRAVLEAAGLTLADVVKTTVFLVSMDDFPAMNGVYQRCFGDSPPARSTVGVAALPKGARVEIEAIAAQ
jgi:2-iminobutanoate/2-iminopropanoate deaminase